MADCSVGWRSTLDYLQANILRETEQGGQPGKLILPQDGWMQKTHLSLLPLLWASYQFAQTLYTVNPHAGHEMYPGK